MKTYVKVMVLYDEDGSVTPLSIQWEDGREYEIDRILDVRKAARHKGRRHRHKVYDKNRPDNYLSLFRLL